MKRIFKTILDLFTSLLDEETKRGVQTQIAEIEQLIDALPEDTKSTEETPQAKEIDNKIQMLIKMTDKVAEMQQKMTTQTQKAEVKNSLGREDFYTALMQGGKKKILAKQAEMGITGSSVLIPVEIAKAVADNVRRSNRFFPKLKFLGLENITLPVALMANDNTGRALGHKIGTPKTKQVLPLTPKQLLSQAIYKIQGIPYEVLRKGNAASWFENYILDEILNQIINECELCILVGDGKLSTDATRITSFETINRVSSDNFVNVSTSVAEGVLTLKEVLTGSLSIQTDSPYKIAVMSSSTFVNLKAFTGGTGGTELLLTNEALMASIQVDEIIINANVVDQVIIFDANSYGIVGDESPEKLTGYDFSLNEQVVEGVGLFGGGLIKINSAAVINITPVGE